MTLSRRDLLKLGAGAGLFAVVGRPRSALARQSALNTVTIPSSGQRIPQIGIGCRSFRTGPDSDELPVLTDTLRTFHRLGGRVLDTSPNYGNSEAVVGEIIADLRIRNDVFVATKVDRETVAEGVIRMETSFDLLGGSRLDLMQVHNLRGVDVQLPTLRRWKEQGRFRHIGVTTSSESQYDTVEDLMRRRAIDFIQVDYSLGNRSADERLIPIAADLGMAVLVNLPFERGRLFSAVGDTPLPDWAAEIDATSWAQVFLKYVMGAPGAVIPIPGTTQPSHAEDNVGAARGRLPSAALRLQMEDFIDPLMQRSRIGPGRLRLPG